MNGTKNTYENYLLKSVNIVNNRPVTNVFQKSQEERELLKKLKNKKILYFENKIIRSFSANH